MRWIKPALALTALITVFALFSPAASAGEDPTASQSDVGILATREGCTGTLFDRTHDGRIDVYVGYTSADGGTNCAWAEKHNGSTAQREDLGVSLYRCMAGTRDGAVDCWVDLGPASQRAPFYLYAGPVSLSPTAGRCIVVDTWYRGVYDHTKAGRCG